MPAKKPIEYKDKNGNTLYGFSQTHLEKTNAKLNSVVFGLKVLIFLLVLLLAGIIAFGTWIAYNGIIYRLIYGY